MTIETLLDEYASAIEGLEASQPMPDADTCKALAYRLGVPDELRNGPSLGQTDHAQQLYKAVRDILAEDCTDDPGTWTAPWRRAKRAMDAYERTFDSQSNVSGGQP